MNRERKSGTRIRNGFDLRGGRQIWLEYTICCMKFLSSQKKLELGNKAISLQVKMVIQVIVYSFKELIYLCNFWVISTFYFHYMFYKHLIFSGWFLLFLWYFVQCHLGCQFYGIQFPFLLCVYAFGGISMRLVTLSGLNLLLCFLIRLL